MPLFFCDVCNDIIKNDAEPFVSISFDDGKTKQRFHEQCFTCNFCNKILHSSTSQQQQTPHLHYGKIACNQCFDQVCNGCKKIEIQKKLVVLPDDGGKYHFGTCLKCFKCQLIFKKENEVSIVNGNVFCKKDAEEEINPFICPTCQNSVRGKWIDANQQRYHAECFQCNVCRVQITDGKYFELDGKIFCKSHPPNQKQEKEKESTEKKKEKEIENDIEKLKVTENVKDQQTIQPKQSNSNANQCPKCSIPFKSGDRSLRYNNEKIHLSCFKCAKCKIQLDSSSFCEWQDQPYCDDDYEKVANKQ